MKLLKSLNPLKNLRRGFATNSSSSHSFVYLKSPINDFGSVPRGEDFGWNDFRLDTTAEKLFYVLVDRMSRGKTWGAPDPTVEELVEDYGDEFPELAPEDFLAASHSYVDHQSIGTIGPDQARDPYVVVFGGNDNSDGSSLRRQAWGEIDWERTEPDNWEEREYVEELKKTAAKNKVAESATASQKKVHLSTDGAIRACRARTRPCPYSAGDHFESREAAEAELARRHGGSF